MNRSAVRVATPEDKDALVRMFERAFEGEPFVDWFVRQDAARPKALTRYFTLMVERMLPHGSVYATEDLTGAAIWAPPGTWQLSPLEQLRMLPEMMMIVGADRLNMIARALASIESERPPSPHYFLALVGTDPSMQRQGIGTALLRPALARCDAEGVPAVLDTYVSSNRAWYEALGFCLHRTIDLGPGAPRGWTLVRAPTGR